MNFKTFKRRYLPHKTWNRWAWVLKGRLLPPPGDVKEWVVVKYARKHRLQILIETGTFEGEMVEAMLKRFRVIHSIEIFEPLYLKSQNKFSGIKHINLHHGDSGSCLPKVLGSINEPALFWLDAHYSGDGTGRGNTDTPILKEIAHIFDHPVRNHVILIDDARLFLGENGYPSIEELRKFVGSRKPRSAFLVQDDIIRIHET